MRRVLYHSRRQPRTKKLRGSDCELWLGATAAARSQVSTARGSGWVSGHLTQNRPATAGDTDLLKVARTNQASLPREVAALEQHERDAGAQGVRARLDVVRGEDRAELPVLILLRVVALAAYHHERGLR